MLNRYSIISVAAERIAEEKAAAENEAAAKRKKAAAAKQRQRAAAAAKKKAAALADAAAVEMAEERAENILGFLLHLQQQSIDLEEGFQVEYGGEEYDFLPKFKDRSVKSSEGSSIQMKCKSMKVVY